MKIGYFDMVGGASGDMILAALVGAGADPTDVALALAQCGLQFDIKTDSGTSSGLAVRRVSVSVPEEQTHRHMHDIREIIAKVRASETAKARALRAFEALASAEAKAHGCEPSEVHFHEVGAVDAIVDIVGASVLCEKLGLDRLVASPFPLGRGLIDCAHGTLPSPAPATLLVLEGCPVVESRIDGETVTPTGAAILSTFCESFGPMPAMELSAIGVGAGTRETNPPNWLRLLVGKGSPEKAEQLTVAVETNIDDMTPEAIAHLMTRLMAAGALDCYATPILMKKGRPAQLVTALCAQPDASRIAELVLTESSSFGVRFREASRLCLRREFVAVATEFGPITVKIGYLGAKELKVSPEFEDCRKAAEAAGVPLCQVQEAALVSYRKLRTG
jgi:pyridinium-3,5-bisthiocarboxylic acid mononucleotide nickel chelatase